MCNVEAEKYQEIEAEANSVGKLLRLRISGLGREGAIENYMESKHRRKGNMPRKSEIHDSIRPLDGKCSYAFMKPISGV